MPMVQPILDLDLKKLEQEFIHRYRDWSCIFYDSLINEHGEEGFVTKEDKHAWSPLWNQ
jgi:hypothetical protein